MPRPDILSKSPFVSIHPFFLWPKRRTRRKFFSFLDYACLAKDRISPIFSFYRRIDQYVVAVAYSRRSLRKRERGGIDKFRLVLRDGPLWRRLWVTALSSAYLLY